MLVEDMTDTQKAIAAECDALKELLLTKNAAYGDSAANPVRIFSKADPLEQINVRIDDKLSRLMRGDDAGEDTELDLIGYLILRRVMRPENKPNWKNMGDALRNVLGHSPTSRSFGF